jgi:hypothetical protein
MQIESLSLRKRTNTCFLVVWLVMVLMLWGSCLQAGTPTPPVNVIRKALTERLISGTANSSLQENPITSANVRAIVHDNLDSSLLNAVLTTTGTDFRFVPSGQHNEAQVAILILTYADEKAALHMTKKLGSRGGYFKLTKILTRFSCAPDGNQLVIIYTENAGNEDVVKFINEFPELLKTAQ